MTVKVVKLVSGEELLADVIGNSEFGLRIKNVVQIILVPATRPGIPFDVRVTPWLPYVKVKEFTLQQKDILLTADPQEEFEAQYNQLFSPITQVKKSGLIIPGK